MDNNSNNLSSSILQSSEPSFPSSSIASTSLSGDDSGFFESLKSINMTTWLIIILILAFLGFNIFVYLAKGTQDIASFFGPLTQKLFGTTASIAGQTVDVAAEGAKAVVSGTATTVNTGLSAVQDITPNNATSSIKSQPVQGQPTSRPSDSGLNKALNNSQEQNMDYQAHEASSSVHSGGGQSGWCFVGEDRGFRSCALVNEDDKCMSGDIFPSQELCINPNLRA
jgi:hypothetical protein